MTEQIKSIKPERLTWKQAQDIIRNMDKKTVLAIAAVSGGDGHSIYTPKAYQAVLPTGKDSLLAGFFTETYKSDGTPKGSLSNANGPVRELTGVYGLRVTDFICGALNLSPRCCLGRGFQAQANFEAITKWANS